LLIAWQNPAFGTPIDLATALAWSLGIGVVGQQASAVSPSTIAGNVGINIPGSK